MQFHQKQNLIVASAFMHKLEFYQYAKRKPNGENPLNLKENNNMISEAYSNSKHLWKHFVRRSGTSSRVTITLQNCLSSSLSLSPKSELMVCGYYSLQNFQQKFLRNAVARSSTTFFQFYVRVLLTLPPREANSKRGKYRASSPFCYRSYPEQSGSLRVHSEKRVKSDKTKVPYLLYGGSISSTRQNRRKDFKN